ncbi:MAG: hypothetical protein ABI137_13905 [Antricoccus sp.]
MRTLFSKFIDDAAMFPPGNASAAGAIEAQLRYRDTWWDTMVGPLLIPVTKWQEFVSAHEAAGSPSLLINVLGTARCPADLPDGVRVAGYELPVTAPPVPEPMDGRSIAVEVTADDAGEQVLAAIATARATSPAVQGKFRTGGTVATAFPDESTLAGVIVEAARIGVPMKFTAGLHHSLRHTAQSSGFEHHGFLNVMLATHRALTGLDDIDAVTAALGERDASVVTDEIKALSEAQQAAVRGQFTSFGCCGVGDPIGDLLKLGLISEDYA